MSLNPVRAASALLVALFLCSCFGPGIASAKHHKRYKLRKVTVSILVTRRDSSPTSTDLRSWGTITYAGHACANFTCTDRVKAHTLVRLGEHPAAGKKHPFRYWHLPNGTKVVVPHITLRVPKNETLEAVYKS